MNRGPVDGRMTADGNLASSAEGREQRALGSHGCASGRVIQFVNQELGWAAVVARFDRQRALPDGGTHDLDRDQLANAIRPAKPAQSGRGKHDRVVLAFVELAQSRVHITAQCFRDQAAAERMKLRRAAKRTGSDFRAALKLGERSPDQSVARIFALRNRRKRQARRQLGGNVLQAVHGDVDRASEQRFLNFLGEQTLSADLGQRDILNPVASGLDDFEARLDAPFGEPGRDVSRLPESELGTARADDDHGIRLAVNERECT